MNNSQETHHDQPVGDSPWALPSSLAPDAALLGQIAKITAQPKCDCLLVGPPGVGKSSFLSALARACTGEPRQGFQVSLMPGRALAELSGAAALFLDGHGGEVSVSEVPVSYDFQVATRWSQGEAKEVEVTAEDWPGRLLFGAPRESASHHAWSLLAARGASCLVLFVDSLEPQRALWEAILPQLLSCVATSAGRLLPRLGRSGLNELPPVLSPKRHLDFERVLVLVTKVDLVCASVLEALNSSELPASGPISPILRRLAQNPHDLANRIDPIRLVEDLLGRPFLAQLSASLKPEAQLAVGLTSAWGLPNPRGRATPGAPRLESWFPFGLREAALFLAAGQSRNSLQQWAPALSSRAPADRFWDLTATHSSLRLSRPGGRP